jgi:hypothetical protein
MARVALVIASVAVLAVAIAWAGTGSKPHAQFDRRDVERAFGRQGFQLADLGLFEKGDQIEAALFPLSGEPFFVYIARNDVAARQAYEPYARLRLPDTVQVLRGNVIAASDSGLGRKDRRRVVAAMRALSAADQPTP